MADAKTLFQNFLISWPPPNQKSLENDCSDILAIVKRNVILRAKPSTSSENLDTLKPKAKLTLINPATRNGFLHVQTEDGDKGWVYAKNVEVSDEEDANEAGGAPVEDDNIAKLLGAHADAVGQPLVIGRETVCGPLGKPGNDEKKKALNNQQEPHRHSRRFCICEGRLGGTAGPAGKPRRRPAWRSGVLEGVFLVNR